MYTYVKVPPNTQTWLSWRIWRLATSDLMGGSRCIRPSDQAACRWLYTLYRPRHRPHCPAGRCSWHNRLHTWNWWPCIGEYRGTRPAGMQISSSSTNNVQTQDLWVSQYLCCDCGCSFIEAVAMEVPRQCFHARRSVVYLHLLPAGSLPSVQVTGPAAQYPPGLIAHTCPPPESTRK